MLSTGYATYQRPPRLTFHKEPENVEKNFFGDATVLSSVDWAASPASSNTFAVSLLDVASKFETFRRAATHEMKIFPSAFSQFA